MTCCSGYFENCSQDNENKYYALCPIILQITAKGFYKFNVKLLVICLTVLLLHTLGQDKTFGPCVGIDYL